MSHEILDSYDFPGSGRHRTKHDWDLLLDGRIHRYTVDGDPWNFRSLAYKTASERGVKVRTEILPPHTIVMQAVEQ